MILQYWLLSEHDEMRRDELCVDATLKPFGCRVGYPDRLWTFDGVSLRNEADLS